MTRNMFQKLTRATHFTCILLLSFTAFAQQRISIGPRVGVNLSNFTGDINNNSVLPGWSVGGFIMYSDINHFGISGDILFSQKGAKFEQSLNGETRSYKQRINYLEIPVLARYFMNKSGNFRPNVFVGPSVAFKLNAKIKDSEVETAKGETITAKDADNSDQFKSVDLGLTAGIALNFQVFPSKRILIDARYTLGLADVNVAPGVQRNGTLTLNAAYGFGLGKKFNR